MIEHSESPAAEVARPPIDLIGLRFDGYAREGNQAAAAAALRHAGILVALGEGASDRGDLAPSGQSAQRGPCGLLNELALTRLVDALADEVIEALSRGRFPFVAGGDCSALIGSLTGAMEAAGPVGLLHVDGHEDTTPIDASEDGEAANCEIGMLLGLTGRAVPWGGRRRLPLVSEKVIALLGQRDDAWLRGLNLRSLSERGIWKRDAHAVAADAADAARSAVAHVRRTAPNWWLHLDVDVLDSREFPAQGLPGYPDEPGGLSRDELTELVVAAVSAGGCIGASLAIYDPDQDPDGSGADYLVGLAGELARSRA